jgi:hypothetical protein
MFDFDPDTTAAPESEAVQAEREIMEDLVRSEQEPPKATATLAGDRQSTDGCDGCGKVADLFHNEATGLSFCESCDAAADTGTVTWKKLRNGAWGVTGPAVLLRQGEQVVVTKRSGETQVKTVRRVLWMGTNRAGEAIAIATVGKA